MQWWYVPAVWAFFMQFFQHLDAVIGHIPHQFVLRRETLLTVIFFVELAFDFGMLFT
jgi:hypothetical protein